MDQFPGLLPLNGLCTEWLGLVGSRAVSVKCSTKGTKPSYVVRLQGAEGEFIWNEEELKEKLKEATGEDKTASPELLSQLSTLGWHHLQASTSPCLSTIVLGESPEGPKLKLGLQPSLFPAVGPTVISSDLPAEEMRFQWNKENSSLKEVFNQFTSKACSLLPLRARLSDLDHHCWVLDPVNPSWRDSFRSVAVAPGVSLRVELDTSCPEEMPKLLFMGPDERVKSLRSNLVDRLHLYDPDKSLSRNLEIILQLNFPPPPSEESASEENFNFDCCIWEDGEKRVFKKRFYMLI